MEKFKQKLASLRGEIDNATKHCEELGERVVELDTQHAKKDDKLGTLQERVKLLKERLEQVQAELKETNANFREADLRAEQLGKKAVKVEQELKAWDKKNKDLEEKYRMAKTEMDELDSQLDGV